MYQAQLDIVCLAWSPVSPSSCEHRVYIFICSFMHASVYYFNQQTFSRLSMNSGWLYGCHTTWAQILALPPTNYVAHGKLLNLTLPLSLGIVSLSMPFSSRMLA